MDETVPKKMDHWQLAIYGKYIWKQFPSVENLSHNKINGVRDNLGLYITVLECAEQSNVGESRINELHRYIDRMKQILQKPETSEFCISCKKYLSLDHFRQMDSYLELIDPEPYVYFDTCNRCESKNYKKEKKEQKILPTFPSCDSVRFNLDKQHRPCNSYTKACLTCNYKFCDVHMNHKHGSIAKMCNIYGCKNEVTMANGTCGKHPFSIMFPNSKIPRGLK
ncbi:MAG: hypothetical protein Terrestrivirus1_283 [Terrestrivirus sp.]|uniref:Uncharacterized protein n=1 Tax=Terrestrivirus sp. TaxID=2487775 RepID=A0A3G4ZPN8_9VIRU|nr:MAG: hypothetical protein Terrestrivirus1_283 [Terrestrivirus sp.]